MSSGATGFDRPAKCRHYAGMVVTRVTKSLKTTLVLTNEELSMLQELAHDAGVSTAQWIRQQVRGAHLKRFGAKAPRPTEPTMRGLITDLTGRAHYTAGNIAERMGVERDSIVAALERLRAKRLVFKVQTHGEDSSWECQPHARNGELQLAEAVKKGVDLDASIE